MKYFLLLLLTTLLTPVFAQVGEGDSVYVRIDKLRHNKLTYGVKDGKLNYIGIFITNKYGGLTSFLSSYNNSKLELINKNGVKRGEIIQYSAFNKLLNKDFLNVFLNTKVYFILSESKAEYLILEVRPILPEELNKQ